MKKLATLFASSAFILSMGLGTSSIASASSFRAPYNTVKMQTIIDNAHQYLAYIHNIEYENNQYTVLGILPNGLEAKLEFAPQTGKLISAPIENKKILTMKEAVSAVEAKGYNHVYGIRMKGDCNYEINAIDQENRKAVVQVDCYDGVVGTEWF